MSMIVVIEICLLIWNTGSRQCTFKGEALLGPSVKQVGKLYALVTTIRWCPPFCRKAASGWVERSSQTRHLLLLLVQVFPAVVARTAVDSCSSSLSHFI